MKVHYNRRQCDQLFKNGDIVNSKVQSYHQSTLHRQANQKFVARFYMPFHVLNCVDELAYHLELLDGSPQFFTCLSIRQKVGMPNLISAMIPCFADTVEWTSFP